MKSGGGNIYLYLGVSLAVEATLLSLAHWQYSRMVEKQTLAETLQSRPTTMLEGTWLTEATTALDNQPHPAHEGQIGWRILTPFQTSQSLVIVDRGWLPLPPNRTAPPDFTNLNPTTTIITGVWETFPTRKGWLKGPDTTTHPRILAWLNPTNITSQTTATTYLQATTATSPHLTAIPPPSANPHKHASYALQWLAMALIFPMLAIYRWCGRRV